VDGRHDGRPTCGSSLWNGTPVQAVFCKSSEIIFGNLNLS
jgi:hypothetical protein